VIVWKSSVKDEKFWLCLTGEVKAHRYSKTHDNKQ